MNHHRDSDLFAVLRGKKRFHEAIGLVLERPIFGLLAPPQL
jgi:hypothetical protein